MRLLSTALCTTVAVALLAGCSGSTSQMSPGGSSTGTVPVTPLSRHHHDRPVWASPANYIDNGSIPQPLPFYRHVIASIKDAGSQPTKGMYVNQFYGAGTMAYPINNKSNAPPFCTVATGSGADVNGIAVDGSGNLITPVAANYSGQHAVDIWSGPGMCGKQIGTFIDPDGQPSGAFSFDAVNGTILISNIFNNSGGAGSVSICTLSGGCTGNLSNPAMFKVAGVVMDKSGNCWASAEQNASNGPAVLVYFAGCTGAGQAATGFMNTDYGSLSFDRNGNLVSVDKAGVQLWVYKGCNPACTLVGGPFPLQGESVFGALNKQSMTFMAGDFANGQVDVYLYTPTSLTYFYSFNNGLSVSGKIEGVAYNPAQKTRK
jgi:hypothetical protein